MSDNIISVSCLKFLIRNPEDHVQRRLVMNHDLYEEGILRDLNMYLPEHATMIDAGAHIGTHSLFWAKYAKAKSIYAFEPLKDIYELLKNNIEINDFEDVIHPVNMGLSEKPGKAVISATVPNITALTQLKDDKKGNIPLESIDHFNFNGEKIDFIKIDTERHELLILKGAKKTINKDKPIVFVETSYETDKEVIDLMTSYKYHEVRMYRDEYVPFFYNRLFFPDK